MRWRQAVAGVSRDGGYGSCEVVRDRYGRLLGGVRSLAAFVDAQTEKPTMTARRLVPVIGHRLAHLINETNETYESFERTIR